MYKKIEELILRKSGLVFSGQKNMTLARLVKGRMAEYEMTSEDSYLSCLESSPTELKILFDLITTKETHFFRNERQFQYLGNVILPALELTRGENALQRFYSSAAPSPMPLRVLCAGCATGEEPYSVAIAILQALSYPLAWDIRIVAGDLSQSSLRIAQAGFYSDEKARAIPRYLRDRYSVKVEDGIRFTEEVKKIIHFTPLNLKGIMDGEPVPETEGEGAAFDIIFCRNVMIYFPPDVQQRLVECLAHLLMPGGYLFTGDAEPLHLFNHDLMVMRDADCLVYRKRESADDDSVIPQLQ